jgi:GT2 family glycosyltransferase
LRPGGGGKSARPAVSVVVPFLGGDDDARAAVATLGRLELQEGDELIMADNTRSGSGVLARAAVEGALRLVPAHEGRSSYHARNVGARAAVNDWLLFLDADCRPPPGLLGAYLDEPPDPRCGALAGAVVRDRSQHGVVARYSESRRYLDVSGHLRHPHRPFGITANLLVRREPWDALGGFDEGTRSGGDVDFCWRLQEAGWELGHRPGAVVEHRHRETLAALLRQARRYGSGHAWLERRYPGSHPPPPLGRLLIRCAGGFLWFALTARFERALFKLIDAPVFVADSIGYRSSAAADPL